MSAVRSLLFVPASQPALVAKSVRNGPDLVVLDLEDAVAEQDKDAARETVADSAAQLVALGTAGLVRINPVESRHFAADLAAVAACADAGVVLPKCEDVEAIAQVRRTLGPDRLLIVGIESAIGVARCRELLAHGELTAAYFGAEDYIGDLGGRRTTGSLEVLYARSEVMLSAHLAGVAAIDQAVVAYNDDDRFLADASVGRDLGYVGKICIHPRQVVLANEVFTPTALELERARAVVDAAAQGVGVLDGQMVDMAHIRLARDVLRRANETSA